MKKFLSGLLVVVVLMSTVVMLSACGEKEEKNNVSQSEEQNTDNTVSLEEITVKSTENTLIMDDGAGTIMTFEFEEEQVVALSVMFETTSEEEAEALKEIYSTEEAKAVYEVKIEGKNVIMEYTKEIIDEMFEGKTKAEIEKELAIEGYTITKE